MPIPTTLAPFFQEYDLAQLDLQAAAPLVIERALQFGSRAELRWLFHQYPRQQIGEWVARYGRERLPKPHLEFWQVVLEITPCSAWGNLVYLAQNVRVGFYGYGYDLVAPLVETPFPGEPAGGSQRPGAYTGVRLAAIEVIALMKLDALLGRAARTDFYDLYFICQKIPLRRILDLAPQKYPSTRDFEAQTVKRLVYFETAEQDVDPQLLLPISWQEVKEYFIKQSKQIAASWLT